MTDRALACFLKSWQGVQTLATASKPKYYILPQSCPQTQQQPVTKEVFPDTTLAKQNYQRETQPWYNQAYPEEPALEMKPRTPSGEVKTCTLQDDEYCQHLF
jgi:hypothetical protein